MEFAVKVYMGGVDMTDYVSDLTVEQPRREVYIRWSARLSGQFDIVEGVRWDIFGSYDPDTNPRQIVLVRAGIVPPDRLRSLTVDHAEVPSLTVNGYDFIWSAMRRGPRETLVVVPGSGDSDEVQHALNSYSGPVGRYRVLSRVETMHEAVERLAARARFRVRMAIPDYDVQPFVVPVAAELSDGKYQSKSYWSVIADLVRPFSPLTHYDASNNTVVFAEDLGGAYRSGPSLSLPSTAVRRITGIPTSRIRVRRVLLEVPEWR